LIFNKQIPREILQRLNFIGWSGSITAEFSEPSIFLMPIVGIRDTAAEIIIIKLTPCIYH
jgi:hypothetical protein